MHFVYQFEHIILAVCVQQTEFLKVNLTSLIVINGIKDVAKVLHSQTNARKLASIHKFLESERSIKIHIKISKGTPIILKLLFNSRMYAMKHILNVHLFIS